MSVEIPINIIGPPKPFHLPKPFIHPCLISLTGTTGAGKTTWIHKFIKNINNMFDNQVPKKILYCYGIYQNLYSEMEKEFDFITFHEGLPNQDIIFSLESPSMIILDDLSHKVCQNTDMELLFTQISHHRNISVCLMKNNLFYQGKSARTISLNTNIYVLMKNPSDLLQIQTLAKRIFPNNSSKLIEAYKFAVEQNNGKGYLVVDLSPVPTINIILKTGIFPDENLILFN